MLRAAAILQHELHQIQRVAHGDRLFPGKSIPLQDHVQSLLAAQHVKPGAQTVPRHDRGEFSVPVQHTSKNHLAEQRILGQDRAMAAERAYEADVEVRVVALTSLLEPILIVVLGGTVGFIAMAILMPLLQMNQLVE